MTERDDRTRYAPVAMFAYSRPEHTQRTLDALAANDLACDTDLIVFQDGPRNEIDEAACDATAEVVADTKGFRSVRLIRRESNIGLADNIISGVGEVVSQNGKVIVVEDDLVTAPHFLSFMNAALNRYENSPQVWHISGWTYPIETDGLEDAFFYRVMNCWGWATWADRWSAFDRSAELRKPFSAAQKKAFNLDGFHDFHEQIRDNLAERRRTWAIFWYATIFRRGGLCLNPARSLVENIGHDGTGENCGIGIEQATLCDQGSALTLPDEIRENELALARIKQHLRISFHRRALRRIIRYFRNAL